MRLSTNLAMANFLWASFLTETLSTTVPSQALKSNSSPTKLKLKPILASAILLETASSQPVQAGPRGLSPSPWPPASG